MKKNNFFMGHWRFLTCIGIFFAVGSNMVCGQESQLSSDDTQTEDSPVHIEANEMLYSSKQDKAYAIGDAWATQRDKKIYADTLIAEFQEVPSADPTDENGSSRELQKLYAKGNVRMVSPTEELTGGQEAIYTIPTEELVVLGDNILLKGGQGILKAHEKLIYDKNTYHAKAYGDAELEMPRKLLKAPFMEAFFIPTDKSSIQEQKPTDSLEEESNLQLKEAYANGGVTIQTPTYVSLSEEAFYNAQTGKADLYGNVKISDGKNIFEGPCGQYDEKTEISKLVPCTMLSDNPKMKKKYKMQKATPAQDGRIHALLYSKKKSKE